MKRIALTGPSGAGKGHVSKMLCQKNIPILDTDLLVRKLYEQGELPQKISEHFGASVLDKNGSINRKVLAQIVFSNKNALASLNAMVHGTVRNEVKNWLLMQENAGAKYAVVEAPLLFEAGMEGDFDLVVSVVAPRQIRLSRICARDGIECEQALARMQNQMSEEQYSQKSHVTIVNDGIADVACQVDKLINNFMF